MVVSLSSYLNYKSYKVRDHIIQSFLHSLHLAQWRASQTPKSAEGMNELLKSCVASLFHVLSGLTVPWDHLFLFSDSTEECYLVSTLSLPGWFPFINFSLKKKKLEFLFSQSLRSTNSSISEGCSVVKGLQEPALEHLVLSRSLLSWVMVTHY